MDIDALRMIKHAIGCMRFRRTKVRFFCFFWKKLCADPYTDTFAEARNAKKERVAKNQFQQMRNFGAQTTKKQPLPSGIGTIRVECSG